MTHTRADLQSTRQRGGTRRGRLDEPVVPVVAPPPLAYSREGAAAACGVSIDVIKEAIRTGRLTVHYPTVAGQKVVILADDLRAWIEASPTRRGGVGAQSHSVFAA